MNVRRPVDLLLAGSGQTGDLKNWPLGNIFRPPYPSIASQSIPQDTP